MSLSKKQRFFKNTAVVSIFTMISRIFGYIRDAAIFIFISNANGALDAFLLLFEYQIFLEEYLKAPINCIRPCFKRLQK